MSDIISYLIVLAFSTLWFCVGYQFGRIKGTKHPFRWACQREGCKFAVGGNDISTVLKFADRHADAHLLED